MSTKEQVRRAHYLVVQAGRHGLLKQQPCEVPNCRFESVRPNSEAHHDDYSKPLEVRWLCRSHHALLHAQLRRENGRKR